MSNELFIIDKVLKIVDRCIEEERESLNNSVLRGYEVLTDALLNQMAGIAFVRTRIKMAKEEIIKMYDEEKENGKG